MTYSTLASIVKYPYESLLAGDKNKFGFFTSERDDYMRVADKLGILRHRRDDGLLSFARHPLVYLVEAADDICYEVMDIEDAHKLHLLDTDRVITLFLNFFPPERQQSMRRTLERVTDPNEQISYLRSSVIGVLVNSCADAFVEHEEEILAGQFEGTLLRHIPELPRTGYEACNRLSWDKIYRASDVVDIELAGTSIITFLMEHLIHAVRFPSV